MGRIGTKAKKHLNEHLISYWLHQSGVNRRRIFQLLDLSQSQLDKMLKNPSRHITPHQVLILAGVLNRPLNQMLGAIYGGLNSKEALGFKVDYGSGVAPVVPSFDLKGE